MRALFLTAALAAALFAAGCGGSPKYANPEMSQVQTDKDKADCEWEASKATGNLADSGERKDRIQDLVDKCMRAKGYTVK